MDQGNWSSRFDSVQSTPAPTEAVVRDHLYEKEFANPEEAFKSIRLMVVEDDPADWHLMRHYLGEVESSWDTFWSGSGSTALGEIQENHFDCIFVDQNLPDMPGDELIESLRIAAGDPWLPVVMVSGQGDEELVAKALRKGATDYLPKANLSSKSLSRCLGNAIKQSRMARSLDQERTHIRELNQQLRKQNDEIQSFYHTVSHELKTPLTAIREFSSLLSDGLLGPVNEEQTDVLDHSIACCDRLVRLVGDLFDAARLETGKLELCYEWFDPAAFLSTEIKIMDTIARQSEITLNTRYRGPVPACRADRLRVGQVITNLVGNAIKFSPPKSQVQVDLSFDTHTEQLVLDVTDAGPGMAPEVAARIFDRLYQEAKGPESSHSGMGIGLYLCRQIIEQHGGNLQVFSSPDNGSRFRARLPLTPELSFQAATSSRNTE